MQVGYEKFVVFVSTCSDISQDRDVVTKD